MSQSCGDGQRCDEGRCVRDEACAANGAQPLLQSVEPFELTSIAPDALSPDGRTTLVHCDKRECILFAVDLMVPSLTETAHVEVPEDVLSIASSRPIACGGVDAIVGGRDAGDPDGISSFYSVRLR